MKRTLPLITLLAAVGAQAATPDEILTKSGCMHCHQLERKLVGPAYKDVFAKYMGQDVTAKLMAKVRKGGLGVWGPVPMPPFGPDTINDADLKTAIEYILGVTTLNLTKGWNLLGNGLDQPLAVAGLFGNKDQVTTVWKWDVSLSPPGWQFYAPSMDAATLQTYASGKGYGVLSSISTGEGFWVNAAQAFTTPLPGGYVITVNDFQAGRAYALKPGWNLVAIGNTLTPSAFNLGLSSVPPASDVVPTNLTTLWTWDNPQSKWYFYSPSLQSQGGTALTDYIAGKDYLDFSVTGKTLSAGVGFWVNKP